MVAGTGRGPLLLNNGDDGLLAGAAWDLEGVPAARGLVFADVDDDGDADAAWSGDGLRLLRQDEGGRFRLSDESLAPAPGTALFGDVDHDGDADLIAAGPGLVLWANDGTGAFADATAAARLAVPGVETAVLSDFDDDRDVDILAGAGPSASTATTATAPSPTRPAAGAWKRAGSPASPWPTSTRTGAWTCWW